MTFLSFCLHLIRQVIETQPLFSVARNKVENIQYRICIEKSVHVLDCSVDVRLRNVIQRLKQHLWVKCLGSEPCRPKTKQKSYIHEDSVQ